jgi:hypothetical protein
VGCSGWVFAEFHDGGGKGGQAFSLIWKQVFYAQAVSWHECPRLQMVPVLLRGFPCQRGALVRVWVLLVASGSLFLCLVLFPSTWWSVQGLL